MMGDRTVLQEAPFYDFSSECHVLSDHLLRSIDRFVTYPACARICVPSTAKSAGPPSTRN